jgi:c-di-AMP phosphodiesterase-like protein
VELLDENTLLVVVDTNRPDMVEAPRLLREARQIVVVDTIAAPPISSNPPP